MNSDRPMQEETSLEEELTEDLPFSSSLDDEHDGPVRWCKVIESFTFFPLSDHCKFVDLLVYCLNATLDLISVHSREFVCIVDLSFHNDVLERFQQ